MHSEQASPKDPLLLIVNGVAGTGKSYLINAIRSLLGTSCAVTATTGKASYNINGCTIHSLLKNSSWFKRQQGVDWSGSSEIAEQPERHQLYYN